MASSFVRVVGWVGFAQLLLGCSSSIGFTTRSPVGEQANTCAPADRAFQVATTAWERKARQRFEDGARRGGVAVRASGCGWTVLDQCHIDAQYEYRALPLSRERSATGREFGVALGGPASNSSTDAQPAGTATDVVVTGVFELANPSTPVDAQVACAGATHVVARYTVGAFRVDSGNGHSASVRLPYGARIETSTWNDTALEAGQVDACTQSPPDHPPIGCSSSIELDMVPLAPPGAQPILSPAPTAVATVDNARIVDACTAGSDDACAAQCRSGVVTGCTALAMKCAAGSLPACVAASASGFGRRLYANP